MIPNLMIASLKEAGIGKPTGSSKWLSPQTSWGLRTAIVLTGLASLWLFDLSTFNVAAQVRGWMEGPNSSDVLWALIGGALAYALLLSVPFVPGVELGIALMILFGVPGIAMAYLGTIFGLCLAFGLGYWVAPSFNFSHTPAGHTQPKTIQVALSKPGLFGKLLSRLNTLLSRHPSLLLAVLLNLPGNSLLGGGGGIGMIFGFARALSWPAYVRTIALATAPVPILFLMTRILF